MRWRIRLSPIIALLGLFASPLTADAGQVLVGNLDQPPVEVPPVIQSGVFWAQEFTTGVSANLTNIVTSLGFLQMPGGGGDFPITVQLISVPAIGDTPDMGTVVDTLTLKGGLSSIPFLGSANVEFDPTKTDSLSSSLFYYFVLGQPDSTELGGSFMWNFTLSTTVHGTGTLPNVAGSLGGDSGSWTQAPGAPFLIQVNGAAVPEPSSWILGCMGFSAVILAGRSLRRRVTRAA
jgi:hypothetical protein